MLCRINLAAALVTKKVLGRQMRYQGGPSCIQAHRIRGQCLRTAEKKIKNLINMDGMSVRITA